MVFLAVLEVSANANIEILWRFGACLEELAIEMWEEWEEEGKWYTQRCRDQWQKCSLLVQLLFCPSMFSEDFWSPNWNMALLWYKLEYCRMFCKCPKVALMRWWVNRHIQWTSWWKKNSVRMKAKTSWNQIGVKITKPPSSSSTSAYPTLKQKKKKEKTAEQDCHLTVNIIVQIMEALRSVMITACVSLNPSVHIKALMNHNGNFNPLSKAAWEKWLFSNQ